MQSELFRLVVTVLVPVFFFVHPALAAEKYFSLFGGTFSPENTSTIDSNLATVTVNYDTGYAVGAAVGADFNGLRIENELIYRQSNPDAWALGWLVNIWYDIRTMLPLTPYMGGGCGFGRGHAASPGIVDNDITGIVYQVGGGVMWKIQQDTTLDLGYRYFAISDTSGGSGTNDLSGPSFLAGVRFEF